MRPTIYLIFAQFKIKSSGQFYYPLQSNGAWKMLTQCLSHNVLVYTTKFYRLFSFFFLFSHNLLYGVGHCTPQSNLIGCFSPFGRNLKIHFLTKQFLPFDFLFLFWWLNKIEEKKNKLMVEQLKITFYHSSCLSVWKCLWYMDTLFFLSFSFFALIWRPSVLSDVTVCIKCESFFRFELSMFNHRNVSCACTVPLSFSAVLSSTQSYTV